MPIYAYYTLNILFPGTSGSISSILGIKHWRLMLIIYSNGYSELILTYLKPLSNLKLKQCSCEQFASNVHPGANLHPLCRVHTPIALYGEM